MDDQDRFIIRQQEFWRACHRLGANRVICLECLETDPICFLGDQKEFPMVGNLLVSRCERCKRKQNAPNDEKSLENQWKVLRDKGIANNRCYCGEENPFCFEPDHLDGRKFSDIVFGVCINCHLKRTRRQLSEYHPDNFDQNNMAAIFRNRARAVIEYLELMAAQLRDIEQFLHNIAIAESDSRQE